MVQENGICPCGSGAAYAECCGRFHGGMAAPTAESLMRSRFSAYALGIVPYIMETTHSALLPSTRADQVRDFAEGMEWKTLEILGAEAGKASDGEGHVEFRAWYKDAGKLECLWEKSRFLREEGKWKYHSGQHHFKAPKIGRNDPCPCGSGKKYKKCCG